MPSRKMLGLALAPLLVALGFAVSLPPINAQPANNGPINVGMVRSFFNDLPRPFIDVATGSFGDLMKTTTGVEGNLSVDHQYLEVAQKLDDGSLQLAAFHGHEYAWIQKKYPKFTPLMLAVNKHNDVSAIVIVHKDSPAKTLADLRGKKIDVPMGTKEQCRVYLRRHCSDNQNDWNGFFSKVVNSTSSIEAMDDVCRGKADAIVVDTITLAFYKDIKGPVFEKNLRVLSSYNAFPSPVIVYAKGGLHDSVVAKIRDGMITAHENPKCKEMFELWQINAFQPIPSNYSEQLATTLKEFPMPEPTKVSQR